MYANYEGKINLRVGDNIGNQIENPRVGGKTNLMASAGKA